MTIDWNSTILAYNRDNHTTHTEKELFMSLYPKHSAQKIGKEILFVSTMVILKKIRSLDIKILPKGRRSPTKWQIFCSMIPSNVFDITPDREIANTIHSSVGVAKFYKTKRLKKYKYYSGRCNPT